MDQTFARVLDASEEILDSNRGVILAFAIYPGDAIAAGEHVKANALATARIYVDEAATVEASRRIGWQQQPGMPSGLCSEAGEPALCTHPECVAVARRACAVCLPLCAAIATPSCGSVRVACSVSALGGSVAIAQKFGENEYFWEVVPGCAAGHVATASFGPSVHECEHRETAFTQRATLQVGVNNIVSIRCNGDEATDCRTRIKFTD